MWEIPYYIENQFKLDDYKWIFNIDIDYFIDSLTDNIDDCIQIFSDDFLCKIFIPIANAYESGKIEVITISLSPECSGGWGNSLNICKKICKIFNIEFDLPNSR
ncbi:hypothetical protein KQI42_03630 [Tissierella sp. MSJ-40]|uniref:Uncharacterized protein n=1 Tax=Tissierella simiarum TaxID=2841534 RepID=A0ABS6E2E8_9FIRM|nr:hypothetical protein [Tissierella simiarum]MBU5437085.1 hypothetical protein [Tissierella simiarum]